MPPTCANPLLLQWLKEWLDLAKERNSKGARTYKTAYDSMKACPMTFNHPLEAQQLHGLGPKLCQRLTDKLEEHCKDNDLPMPAMPYKGNRRPAEDDESADTTQPPKKQRKKEPKKYNPAFRSGAYALLLGLLSLPEDARIGLTKDELIDVAQPNCDANFTVPSEAGKFYTAWNSMKTLVTKDLVHEHGRPLKRYMLTDEGREVALRQKAEIPKNTITEHFGERSQSQNRESSDRPVTANSFSMPLLVDDDVLDIDDVLPSQQEHLPRRLGNTTDASGESETLNLAQSANISTNFTPIVAAPGTFDVRLVIDNREIRSTHDRDYISEELAKRGVTAITRALPVGDALWVAKIRDIPPELLRSGDEGVGKDEIVLDHIVERKRLDDLIGSIKDGRFHEQKFRLRRSGVQNVTYLVENFTISEHSQNKMGEAVNSAIASTQVVNGFFVKRTEKIDDTIRYLARMTSLLKSTYEKKPLYIIPSKVLHPQTYLSLMKDIREKDSTKKHYITFAAFHSLSSKSADLTLRDVYLKMLMCCRGVTGEKAIEIQKKWKTPRQFVEAYEAIEERRKKDIMVSDQLQTLVPRKKIAKQLSTRIAEVWAP